MRWMQAIRIYCYSVLMFPQHLKTSCDSNWQCHSPREIPSPEHLASVTSSSLASFLASSRFFLSGIRSSRKLSSRFEKQKSITLRIKTRAKTFTQKREDAVRPQMMPHLAPTLQTSRYRVQQLLPSWGR